MTQLRRDRIGFVFQSFNLVPTLTALENITLADRRSPAASRTPQWLDTRASTRSASRTGSTTARPSCPAGSSSGSRARALAGRPEIIFGDEPTGNLDSRSSGEVLGILRRRRRPSSRQTVVIVTHDPDAAPTRDRVVFLADGRIVDETALDPTAEAVLDRMKRLDEPAHALASDAAV